MVHLNVLTANYPLPLAAGRQPFVSHGPGAVVVESVVSAAINSAVYLLHGESHHQGTQPHQTQS